MPTLVNTLSGGIPSHAEEAIAPAVICLCNEALSAWHLGEIASSQATMAEAITVAKQLDDMHTLVMALWYAGLLNHYERKPAEVERFASDVIELSTLEHFGNWLPGASILRGWARSASGSPVEGIRWIEDGLRDYRAIGGMIGLPFWLVVKAEALYLGDRTSEALEAIKQSEALAERSAERWWCAELHRFRAVFLKAIGADETQIEASFCQAIRTAKQQKSTSLAMRAESSYAEYRGRKGRDQNLLGCSG